VRDEVYCTWLASSVCAWFASSNRFKKKQLLAYYIADMRKCNVDQPRNLAKSVTVE